MCHFLDAYGPLFWCVRSTFLMHMVHFFDAYGPHFWCTMVHKTFFMRMVYFFYVYGPLFWCVWSTFLMRMVHFFDTYIPIFMRTVNSGLYAWKMDCTPQIVDHTHQVTSGLYAFRNKIVDHTHQKVDCMLKKSGHEKKSALYTSIVGYTPKSRLCTTKGRVWYLQIKQQRKIILTPCHFIVHPLYTKWRDTAGDKETCSFHHRFLIQTGLLCKLGYITSQQMN